MAIFIRETEFIRGGGNSPADCILYGTFSGDGGETIFTIVPGVPTDGDPQPGSSSLRNIKFVSVECTSATGQAVSILQNYDPVNLTDVARITIPNAGEEFTFKIEGKDSGQ